MVKETDIRELEIIINKLNNATSFTDLSRFDSDFHKKLFAITSNVEFFDWWTIESDKLNSFLYNLWETIGYKTKPYDNLIKQHNVLFEAIKNRNGSAALDALLHHFAIVLKQLLAGMYETPATSLAE
jgi:DNA-binding GntR family transcriptional regulator